MEAKTIFTITKQDIIEFLNNKGYGVPSDSEFYTEEHDCRSSIVFPLVIETPYQGPVLAGFGPTTPLPQAVAYRVSEYANSNKRIDAIREIRAAMKWSLKDAKEWLDHNYPQ